MIALEVIAIAVLVAAVGRFAYGLGERNGTEIERALAQARAACRQAPRPVLLTDIVRPAPLAKAKAQIILVDEVRNLILHFDKLWADPASHEAPRMVPSDFEPLRKALKEYLR